MLGVMHAVLLEQFTGALDLAGVIEETGPGVRGFAVGDEVYGLTGGAGVGTALGQPQLVTDGDVKDGRYASGVVDIYVGAGPAR
jgi:NADPH:quinone reductase-like Zn-dependent oxidoreductase